MESLLQKLSEEQVHKKLEIFAESIERKVCKKHNAVLHEELGCPVCFWVQRVQEVRDRALELGV